MSHAIATLAGGCFWCIETIFNRLRGVESALVGYMGDTRLIRLTRTSATATLATPKWYR